MRRLVSLASLLISGGGSFAASAVAPRTTVSGVVVAVPGGDSIAVATGSGAMERVRLRGVMAPPPGACFAAGAAAVTRGLALGRRVKLVERSRSTAYAHLTDGTDLGRAVVAACLNALRVC